MNELKPVKCWCCGSTDIKPDERGTICRECGATDNYIPKPSHERPSDEGAVETRKRIRQGDTFNHI